MDDDAWGKRIKSTLMESLGEVEDFYDADRRSMTARDLHPHDTGSDAEEDASIRALLPPACPLIG